jgi:hypothetical protein
MKLSQITHKTSWRPLAQEKLNSVVLKAWNPLTASLQFWFWNIGLVQYCYGKELRIWVPPFQQDGESGFHHFHPVAALLSYLTKAPLVPDNTPVVNALSKQRAALENVMRACVGLPPENNMMLEFK